MVPRALAGLLAVAVPTAAQTTASLGLGVGTVRYAGGSRFSAGTLTPTIQLLTPWRLAGAGGSLAALPHGAWAASAQADGWISTGGGGGRGAVRLALGASLGGNTRTDAGSAVAAHGIAEVLWVGGGGGVALGAGASSGHGDPGLAVQAERVRGRAWWAVPGAHLSASVEPTRFEGAWYTDVNAGATLERGPLVASVWVTGRFSDAYGSKGTAGAQVQYFVSPRVSLEGAVGGFLADPFLGFPRARSVSAGIRLHASPRPPPGAPRGRWPALAPERRGDSVVVRFHMPGARALAIAGDWSAWRPIPLRPLGGDAWEAALELAPGSYHFNLLLNGEEWVVPDGVALVPDGMGGLVAVLVILPPRGP